MKTVLEYLEKTANELPDKVAFISENESITFSLLRQAAKKIATGIQVILGNKNQQAIVVISDRTIQTIITFFGVLYSGNFYVPIDSEQPAQRINQLAMSISPKLLIVNNFPLDEIEGSFIVSNSKELQKTEELFCDFNFKISKEDFAYAIFTSGSTGTPKCVVKTHRSIMSFVDMFTACFYLDHNDILGNQANFDYDVSAKDIYVGLKTGATVYILDSKGFIQPKILMDELVNHHITVLIWATFAVSLLAMHKVFSYRVPHELRYVFFSGEVLPIKHLKMWQANLPNTIFANLYAPYENGYVRENAIILSGEHEQDYIELFCTDFQKSKLEIEEGAQKEVNSYAYPNGVSDTLSNALLKKWKSIIGGQSKCFSYY